MNSSPTVTISPESQQPKPVTSSHFIKRLKPIPGIGIFFAALSGIFFAFCTSMVKFLVNINPFEILFFRSVIQMAIYLVIILLKHDYILGATGERLWMVITNFVGFLFLGLAYLAVRLISLGDSSAIIFSSSVYASVFARFILNEPCNLINVICIIMVISGVFLISRPNFLFGTTSYSYSSTDRTFGLVLSLVASLSAALTYVLMRKLRKTATSVEMFWFSTTDAILSLIVTLSLGQMKLPTLTSEWILLMTNGIVGTAGLLLLGWALKLEDAGPVSLARTIDIVAAFIIQVTLLHDPALWTSVLGSVIIICGVGISAMRHFIISRVKLFHKNLSLQQPSAQIETISHRKVGPESSSGAVPTVNVTQH